MALAPLYSILVDPVTVVVGEDGAAAGDVAVPVASLATAIPAGTILHFGTTKFAKLATAAEADDTELDTLPIPTALVEDDQASYQPPSPIPLLGDKWTKLGGANLTTDERTALQTAYHIAAEIALDLRAPVYTGDDAAELSFHVARQILFMIEHGITSSLVKSASVGGSPGATRNYRDRWVDPLAAEGVARVTGVVQPAFSPPPLVGV